jgi:hypothetical protein
MEKLKNAIRNGLLKLKRLFGLFVLTIDRNAVSDTYLRGKGIETFYKNLLTKVCIRSRLVIAKKAGKLY